MGMRIKRRGHYVVGLWRCGGFFNSILFYSNSWFFTRITSRNLASRKHGHKPHFVLILWDFRVVCLTSPGHDPGGGMWRVWMWPWARTGRCQPRAGHGRECPPRIPAGAAPSAGSARHCTCPALGHPGKSWEIMGNPEKSRETQGNLGKGKSRETQGTPGKSRETEIPSWNPRLWDAAAYPENSGKASEGAQLWWEVAGGAGLG